MTLNDWIFIAVSIVGGIVVGAIASRVVRSIIGSESRPEPVRNAAGPLASLALWACVVVGLILALGVLSPTALEQLPRDLIDFVPRVISAAIVVIVANVGASFAQAAIAPAVGRMSARVQRQVLSGVRLTILSLAVLLAVRQLGFDTTVINLAVAAVFFGLAGALMLLVSLGGRHVASEVASTRVLRRLVNPGDRVELDGIAGTVVGVHPTAVEIVVEAGRHSVMVPSSRFVSETFRITRADADSVAD
ncbi:MAG: hypothetical protein AAF962_27605 [Actinomycetota bacterium]